MPESAHDLLRALLGEDPALEGLERALTARTEGNPLFLTTATTLCREMGMRPWLEQAEAEIRQPGG